MASHSVVSDTVHIVERETVWMPPDTLGRQYPVKTTTREAGSNRLSQNETIIRQRDTVFVSEERASASEERGDVRGRNLPWVAVIVAAVVVLVIGVFVVVRR